MRSYQHGDRVRVETIGDDGLPLVRYGFVGGLVGERGPVVVMLDGDLKNDMIVDRSEIQPVTITGLELRLQGTDLLDDPALRQGLVNLWSAEAEEAGLAIGTLRCIGAGVRDSRENRDYRMHYKDSILPRDVDIHSGIEHPRQPVAGASLGCLFRKRSQVFGRLPR